jgi:hypothetical protein
MKKGKASMDSTLGPAQTNTHQDSGEIKAAQEALSRVLQEATAIASDRRADMAGSALRVVGPSIDTTLHSAEPKDDRFQSVRPSFGRRASRALARFLIPAFIGVAGTLALESYGEAAKQIIASWVPQLGWPISLLSQLGRLQPAINSPSSSESVAEQSSTRAVQASTPDAPQAVPVAQAAPDPIAAGAAPAVPSPDQQLLEAMARDLASVQQRVEKLATGQEKLATGQEKLARDIARLQAAEKDIRHKISVPPQPAATPAPKPMPVMPPEQAVPQASTAPPPPAQPTPPPTQLRPPVPVR